MKPKRLNTAPILAKIRFDGAPFIAPIVNKPLPTTVIPPAPTAYTGSDIPQPAPSSQDAAANIINTLALKSGAGVPVAGDPASGGQPGATTSADVQQPKAGNTGLIIALVGLGFLLWKGSR